MNLFRLFKVPKQQRYPKGTDVIVKGRQARVICDTGRKVNVVYTWGLWHGRHEYVNRDEIDCETEKVDTNGQI